MSCLKHIERLRMINNMIRRRNTGSATEMGFRLGISERSVYYYLKDLKLLGAPVCWSATDNSYTYEIEGNLRIEFQDEIIIQAVS